MRDPGRAEDLLSLFTSGDRAAAIAGDLMEEHQHRSTLTFWLDVVGTTIALWRSRVTGAPLRAMALAVSACVRFAGPAAVGLASVFLFPQWVHSPVKWVPLALCWWGGALWTGISLVDIAPSDGMAVGAALALTAETVLLASMVKALWLEPSSNQWVSFYTAGVVAAPFLVSGAIARRRLVAKHSLALEEQP